YATERIRNYCPNTLWILLRYFQARVLKCFLNGDKGKMRHQIGALCQFVVDVVLDDEGGDFPSHLDWQIGSGKTSEPLYARDAIAGSVPEVFYANAIRRYDTKTCNNHTSIC